MISLQRKCLVVVVALAALGFAVPAATVQAGPFGFHRAYHSHAPAVRYVDHCGWKHCGPTIKMVLKVQNPWNCCLVDVPVCVPACCSGPPMVSHHGCTLFGIKGVHHTWHSGHKVNVVFHKHGGVVVHYH